jgi:hypothetical protein
VGLDFILLACLSDAGYEVSFGCVDSDVVPAVRLIDQSDQFPLVGTVFSVQVNDLQICDVARDGIAVLIGDHALVGGLVSATVGGDGEGERIGLCAFIIALIVLDLNPISAVETHVPLILKRGRSFGGNGNGAYVILGVVRIVLPADLRIGHLGNDAPWLLEDQDDRLTVEAADGTVAVLIVNVSGLVGDMGGLVAESAGTPVVRVADLPGGLGGCGVRAACVAVFRCDMIFKIVIADATVVTIAALRLQTDGTAAFAKEQSFRFAAAADIAVVETVAAILAKMRIIVAVFRTERRRIRAIGVALTAVKAKLTFFTHLNGTKSISAIGANMVVPIGTLNTVFSAITAL